MIKAMACIFYLCAVPYHVSRMKARGPSGESQRIRFAFPQLPFFMELVNRRDLQCWLSQKHTNRTPQFHIIGIFKGKPGILAQDTLSQYAHRDELQVWTGLWRGISNAYTVIVEELLVFDEALQVYTCSQSGSEGCGCGLILVPFAYFC